MKRLSLLALLALLSGCGDGAADPAPPEPGPSCDDLELTLPDGGCLRPGVPPDACGEGFVHDGVYGCEPILPIEPCPFGLMAVPGDEACRPVMECGEGKWGDLPVDSTTQYVDGSYPGGDGDGSEAKPWPTIGQAVTAAAPGALIAVAAGSYSEAVLVGGKPVRLWGRCPEQVTIESTGQAISPCPPAALCVIDGAHGTEVGGLAIRGAGLGITVSGSENVLIDRVWVHDNASRSILAEAALGPTSITVSGSLIEQNRDVGVTSMGSQVTLDRSVVRATLPDPADQSQGQGIAVQSLCHSTPTSWVCDPTARGSLTMTRSLVEQNRDVGVMVLASDLNMDRSVVRTTQPRASDQMFGTGVSIQVACKETPSGVVCDLATRASATVTGSLIEQNHDTGLYASGSDLIVDATVVRSTWPRASDQGGGMGIRLNAHCDDGPTGLECDPATRSVATMTRSLIEQSHTVGVAVSDSDATLDAVVVRGTVPRVSDALFGDGLVVVSETTAASATITHTLIADSARAGLATFGGFVSLANGQLRCAAFALAGDTYRGQDFEVDDQGGNLCGCPTAKETCKLVTAGLAPPGPIR